MENFPRYGTPFTLTTSDWIDEDVPLRYIFYRQMITESGTTNVEATITPISKGSDTWEDLARKILMETFQLVLSEENIKFIKHYIKLFI